MIHPLREEHMPLMPIMHWISDMMMFFACLTNVFEKHDDFLTGFFAYRLCWEKFGWGSQKVDELIIPVLKEYDKREVRSTYIFSPSLSLSLSLIFTQAVSSTVSPNTKSKLIAAYNLSDLYFVDHVASSVDSFIYLLF